MTCFKICRSPVCVCVRLRKVQFLRTLTYVGTGFISGQSGVAVADCHPQRNSVDQEELKFSHLVVRMTTDEEEDMRPPIDGWEQLATIIEITSVLSLLAIELILVMAEPGNMSFSRVGFV